MHSALRLEEILFNIFTQCYSQPPTNRQCSSHSTSDLAVLARTCRTFKEPALDVLWTELTDLSPLARCLPEVSRRIYPSRAWYSFSRPLNQTEWGTLRSYTRRVRSVLDFTKGLNWDSVKTLFNPPIPDPLFPNLRILRWEFIREIFPLMHHLAVPSLTSLEINFVFGDVPSFHNFPHSLGDLCPNIRQFRISTCRPQAGSDEAISALVRRWGSLQVVSCPYVSLDSGALAHLSRTHSLTHLSFALSASAADCITTSYNTILFSKVRDLEIYSQSLESVSKLFSHTLLPVIETLTVCTDSCPSREIVRTFLVGVQRSCNRHSLVGLRLIQTRSHNFIRHELDRCHLTLDDIRPCMAFDQLRWLEINIASIINLSDNDLLLLASACPRTEHLLINEEWGWNSGGGVTPDGLLQLLQILQSLRHFCLAIDTVGYTRPSPALHSARVAGIIPRIPLLVNVADSAILPESVEALADFFGGITKRPRYAPVYWGTTAMANRLDSEIWRRLWEDVFAKADEKANVTMTTAGEIRTMR